MQVFHSITQVFDESGNFLLYPTLHGIKVVNILTNNLVRLIGSSENIRFMNIALYQNAPKRKNIVTAEMAASDNPLYNESERTDPTIFCTAFKKHRFHLLTNRVSES